ncbi:MAG: hypothetical protein K2X93_09580 [Candidatus Obscuribacterales bacterium]|nr:hypothetical protein [Candidatus Obscuribacterales bacterium]
MVTFAGQTPGFDGIPIKFLILIPKDQEAQHADIVRGHLKSLGYEVEQAKGLARAIRLLRRRSNSAVMLIKDEPNVQHIFLLVKQNICEPVLIINFPARNSDDSLGCEASESSRRVFLANSRCAN